jgi:hypothetical protein
MTQDAPPEFVLRSNFRDNLCLSDDACDWLMMLWQAIQAIDDIVDGEEIDHDSAIALGWNVLVAMPGNPFFQKHSSVLLPAMGLQFAKWKASDDAERDGRASATAFVWRASYYDMVLMAVQCEHGGPIGVEIGQHVMEMYGENYDTYISEMKHA